MKKALYVFLILLLISSVLLGASACKAKIKTDRKYYTFTYDSRSDSFVKMGSSLRFTDDFDSFEYSFGESDLSVFGAVEHTDEPDSYVITCSDEVINMVTDRYRQSMVDNDATQEELAFFDVLAANFVPRAQYFAYDGKLFTGDSIELFHAADKDSDSLDGLFRMDSTDEFVRLRGGFAYTKDEDGEYT